MEPRSIPSLFWGVVESTFDTHRFPGCNLPDVAERELGKEKDIREQNACQEEENQRKD
jgi:hypothetical protein